MRLPKSVPARIGLLVVAALIGLRLFTLVVSTLVRELVPGESESAENRPADAPPGYLGVVLAPLTADTLKAEGLHDVTGAVIANVVPDSPAAKAGIRPGNLVVGVDGQGVASIADLQERGQHAAPGTRLTLTLLRPGPRGVLPTDVYVVIGEAATAAWTNLPATGAATLALPAKAEGQNVPNFADERTDFGVPPQAELRDGSHIGTQTPTTIPGLAGVIQTVDLMELLQQDAPVVLVDAWNDGGQGHATIPGAAQVPFAGSAGSFDDDVQRDLVQALAVVTHGNRDANLVFFCKGAVCWESYNAVLRTIHAGYPHVYWYRGGLTSWQQAGYPVKDPEAARRPPQQYASAAPAVPALPPGAMAMPGMGAMPMGMPDMGGMAGIGGSGNPMDMSGLINRQMELQVIGDQAAQQAAWSWFNGVQQYRMQTGDWTSPINPPVTNESLQASIRGAQAATDQFIQSGVNGSNARAAATENYSTRGILGLNEVYDPSSGNVVRVDGSYNTFFRGQYGEVQGTYSYTAPPGTTPLKARW